MTTFDESRLRGGAGRAIAHEQTFARPCTQQRERDPDPDGEDLSTLTRTTASVDATPRPAAARGS